MACQYYDYDGKLGECRRRHPSTDPVRRWPRVEMGDWCGEYISQDGVPFGSEALDKELRRLEEKDLSPSLL